VAAARARRGSPFTARERDAIVATFREAWEAKERLELTDPAADVAAQRRVMAQAAEAYVDGVPILAISRSPLSGEAFETSLDTFDLDGLWWAYDYDYRPYVEAPADLFAWTGALKVDGPLPAWSLKAMPGPDVPFVMPSILAHAGITAVISGVRVGSHVGFPIAYFADPLPDDVERVDDWGHRTYTYRRADGSPASAHAVQADEDKDFDLRPWVERGRVQWIAPGDDALELHRGTDGCPYLDLPGERRRRYVQEGDTWFA
jgi:hypothetical protein